VTERRDPVTHRPPKPVVVLVAPEEWPAAAAGWLAVTRKDWEEFGRGELAGMVKSSAMPGLRHLFELRDQRERWTRASRGSKALTDGSMGQTVVNPLLKQMPSLNREIAKREAEFGMTPASYKKLVGGTVAGDPERRTLAQLLDDLDDEDAAAAGDDPRLRVLDGTG
jgi:hypothetical protein